MLMDARKNKQNLTEQMIQKESIRNKGNLHCWSDCLDVGRL